MCGIAGAVSAAGIDPTVLRRMADAIVHRGPDGRGFLLYGPQEGPAIDSSLDDLTTARTSSCTVGFAHLRLSIIDLSAANDQPMFDSSGGYAIAYNGEIYNYIELREELEALGDRFETTGDTEVLLAAYARWGPACLERLVGMWAFAVLDLRRRSVFLARDRFGIKPLYYAFAGDACFFGSEIKALLQVPSLRREPNEAVVRRYLLMGATDDSEATFFDGILRLPPAHHLTLSLDGPPSRPRPQRFWSIPAEGYEGSAQDAGKEFADLLTESVAIHARSDVPVGTCLSGGLDSSSIVCIADGLRRRGEIPQYAHHGFGYVPHDSSFSERPYMEQVVDQTSIDMEYVEVPRDTFESALVELARQQDEPFGSLSIAAQSFVFDRAHRAGMKVMLDGQGADEILGGYHAFFAPIGTALLRHGRLLEYAQTARMHQRTYGAPLLSRRQLAAAMMPAGVRHRLANRFTRRQTRALLTAEFRARGSVDDSSWPEFATTREMLAAHTTSLGLPALLRFEDRNSMAHSIEARVPFLDHRLVEFCFRMPTDYKIDGVMTKQVLREAVKGIIPEGIRTRTDKIGFRAEPSATWNFATRHQRSLRANRTDLEARWFDADAVGRLLETSARTSEAEFVLWRVINTKLWLRSFWADPATVLA